MTPDGMDRLVELLDSAIDYIGIDQPELVEALVEARAVVVQRAAEERSELATELAGMDRAELGPELTAPDVRQATTAPATDPEYPMTPEGVRAALWEVLAYHHEMAADGHADASRYAKATEFLRGVPPLPGALGRVVADVLGPAEGSTLEESLAEVARSLGSAPPRPEGNKAPRAIEAHGVAQLQEVRDAALDRAIGATLRLAGPDARAGGDSAAVADARSWAGLHQRAVEALARAGAAESPRLVPSGYQPDAAPGLEEAVTVAGGRSPALGPPPPGVEPSW
jgi:hypothetical protein